MAATLRLENVGLRFAAGPELLSDLDLALYPGELLLVTGARGAGLSSLAALAALARRPDRGRIHCLGADLARLAPAERARLRRRIGFCPERPVLVPGLDPVENVALALRVGGSGGAREAQADAADLLAWLDGPGAARRLSPRGERIVGLARALVTRPALVVLDQPLRAGDAQLAGRLRAILEELLRQDAAVLVTADAGGPASQLQPTRRLHLTGGRLADERAPAAAGPIAAPA